MQHSFCTTLGGKDRNTKFTCVIYNHIKTWTMITYLCSNYEIGTPGHELSNDKWL